MRKNICILICLFLLLGCSLLRAEYIGTTDKDVTAIADPIMDNILKGMKNNDYKTFSKDFSDTMKANMTKDTFLATNKQMTTQMGAYKSRTYVAFKNQENMTVIYWTGVFANISDINITLVLSKADKKYLVEGLWFTKSK